MVDFKQKDFYNIDDLLRIMQVLRSDEGCPWDKEQNHLSIKNNFLEEVCEAMEAIDLQDKELLREELGDVLLQVVFHCQMENETDTFDFNDVCDEVCKKLIVRHPHVFGDVDVSNSDEVLKNWDKIKKETKGQETYTDTLNSVAKTLPALMRAQKVGKRAMRAGMDFECADDAFKCVKLESDELSKAIKSGNAEAIEDEMGDLLFSCVNTARHLGIDAEEALKKATDKFIKRFEKTEKLLTEQDIDMKSLSIDKLDEYWNQAKAMK